MLEVQWGVGAAYTSLHKFTIGIGNSYDKYGSSVQ
jgi:hypothetical protein